MAILTSVLFAGLVVAATVLLCRHVRAYLYFRKLELDIPGPPSQPVVGNGLAFFGATSDNVLQIILKLVDKRREMTRVTLFNHMILFVNDPADIQKLVRRKEFNDKSHFVYNLLHVVVKRGLIQLGGAEWKAHRRALQPGFAKYMLDNFVEVFGEEAKGFVHRAPVGKETDLLHLLRRASIRNFLRTAISEGMGPDFEEELMAIMEFLDVFLRSINNRSFNPLLWSDRIFNMTATGRWLKEMKVTIEETTKNLLHRKRQSVVNDETKDIVQQRKTLVDVLAEDQGTGSYKMTEEDVLDEIKTFFGANVETTVSSISWLLKILSLRPEIQEKVYAEVCQVLPEDRLITVDDLPQLRYTECFVKETLRMFPAVPMTGRQVYEETELCDRVIPAGSTLIVNILAAHHDPHYWEEPERFDPDRFLPENATGRQHCAFMPFSAGSRNCIGGQYAMMNLKTFLATTLRAYRIDPADDGHLTLKSLLDNMTFDLSSRLVGGTRVIFTPRSVRTA